MNDLVRIKLQPLGKTVEVERGVPLQEVLFAFGVEFPCGGHGRCKTCRVRVLSGSLPVGSDQTAILSPVELSEGWRLACRCFAIDDLTLEIDQWEIPVLSDDSALHFKPGTGTGIAVDLGTTTLVAQLVNLQSGQVLAVKTGLNPQAVYGGDVMSRIHFALSPEGSSRMKNLIREKIGELLHGLWSSADPMPDEVREIAIVGNTVMHHLFCGIDVTPLAHYPFQPRDDGLQVFQNTDLGWQLPGNPLVRFLPCVGGFVGSDILAGVMATRLDEGEGLSGLIDLGTNGEVVLASRGKILCASTAAGPAFEGARIRMGMRAATGAIAEVRSTPEGIRCRVLGGGAPRGICGSGLVDAIATALDHRWIENNGRFTGGVEALEICPPVSLYQSDVRELQLAKGAIAAAVRLLLKRLGAEPGDLSQLFLAGAFGNYVDRASARRIGLIDFPEEKIHSAGNTALLGAKLALFEEHCGEVRYESLRRRIEHVPLFPDPDFHEVFVECMAFPPA
jgi:uncharacterized 2Fe-2S/4Fe-4S cluster protein (DUF4445 family)